MVQKDAELFLGWAADAFVAAGRTVKADQRLHHRRRAELFCDIFHELKRNPSLPPPTEESEWVVQLLGSAFKTKGGSGSR